jgi:asparagine synthase (glutamine-hydrolysing)
VNTCSIGFDDRDFDESPYADQVAQQYGTAIISQVVSKDDYGLIDTLARPVRRAVRRQLGDPDLPRVPAGAPARHGGLVGRRRRREFRRLPPLPLRHGRGRACVRACRPGLRKPLFGTLGKLYPKADWAPRMFRAKTTFEALARDLVEGYFHGVAKMPDRVRDELFTDKVPQRAARLPRDRGDAQARRQFADRRSALADPVPRFQDLPAGRHPDQGRPRQHGAFAGSARAAARPQVRRMASSNLPPSSSSRAAKASTSSRRRSSRTCRTTSCTAPSAAFRSRSRPGCAARCANSVRQAVLSQRVLDTGIFNEGYLRHMVDSTNRHQGLQRGLVVDADVRSVPARQRQQLKRPTNTRTPLAINQ